MSADAHTHTLPTAPTQLTDRRAGEEIDPRWVTCPGCGKDGKTRKEINRCHNCGEWFEVVLTAGAEAAAALEAEVLREHPKIDPEDVVVRQTEDGFVAEMPGGGGD